MKKLILLLIFAAGSTFASLPLKVSMFKVVTESDHVLTVEVVDVDMIDGKGKQIVDSEARTGPGIENVIRLICKVKEVHASNEEETPDTVKIPLDNFMHYSLGQIKEAYKGEPYPTIVVLKGSNFLPAYAGIFSYPMHELETVMALYSLKK